MGKIARAPGCRGSRRGGGRGGRRRRGRRRRGRVCASHTTMVLVVCLVQLVQFVVVVVQDGTSGLGAPLQNSCDGGVQQMQRLKTQRVSKSRVTGVDEIAIRTGSPASIFFGQQERQGRGGGGGGGTAAAAGAGVVKLTSFTFVTQSCGGWLLLFVHGTRGGGGRCWWKRSGKGRRRTFFGHVVPSSFVVPDKPKTAITHHQALLTTAAMDLNAIRGGSLVQGHCLGR
jgi:hypothetical protein